MTDDGTGRRRAFIAAGLWFLLAFCVWNVRFDWGVRVGASQYLQARDAYLHGRGPKIELAGTMHGDVDASAWYPTMIAMPAIIVGIVLTFVAARANRHTRRGL